jgi:hypothetical protein
MILKTSRFVVTSKISRVSTLEVHRPFRLLALFFSLMRISFPLYGFQSFAVESIRFKGDLGPEPLMVPRRVYCLLHA